MKSYLSLSFLLLLLPIAILLYNLTPEKRRRGMLLFMDFCFFFYFSRKMTAFLIFSVMSIHHFGLWLGEIINEEKQATQGLSRAEKKQVRETYEKQKLKVMTGAVLVHIGILVILKYTGFIFTNINMVLSLIHFPLHLPIPKLLLPLGISFYTLSAVSYLFDVYRGKIEPDKNIWRLALFLSFFPTIMEGPICRYSDTAESLWKVEKVSFNSLTSGYQRILWGMLKKVVIADRLNELIQTVFTKYPNYNGTVVFIGMIAYTIQLYMEFSGTMDAVIGVGEIFHVQIPENFRQPFFSKSISDFWARWHITLGTWFRDYIYYPLSLTGPLKKLTTNSRKKLGNYYGPLLSGTIALFAVWLANGLWHGAAWSFIFFGMYHFFLILMGRILEPVWRKLAEKLHFSRDAKWNTVLSVLRTTLFVCIGELFFRAEGLKAGLAMFKQMITGFSFGTFSDGTLLKLGMDSKDFIITGITLIIVLIVSICREKGINLRQEIAARPIVLRWSIYYAVIFFIMIFGAYGMGYIGIDPIYAGF